MDVARERVSTLHKSITTQIIRYGHRNLKITVSMGLSFFPSHGETKEDILRAADRALYAAKRAGRNRVYIYQELKDSQESVDEGASSSI
jgi:diguanylate cyclase (GGDEF)-like protein